MYHANGVNLIPAKIAKPIIIFLGVYFTLGVGTVQANSFCSSLFIFNKGAQLPSDKIEPSGFGNLAKYYRVGVVPVAILRDESGVFRFQVFIPSKGSFENDTGYYEEKIINGGNDIDAISENEYLSITDSSSI